MIENSERLARMEAIFHEALPIAPSEQSALLQKLCGDDRALFLDVQRLLRAAERERAISGNSRYQESGSDGPLQERTIGAYRLQSLLGRGGMGAVYLARRADGQYEKQVAIKLIDAPLASDLFRERFRHERQILAGLDHPGIARLLDGGVSDDGVLYLVMDYVDGKPIDAYARENLPTIAERLDLFGKVCEAVQFAHRNLVIHRDLKPDNILVSDDGTPHLLDFGTAKLLTPDTSDSGSQSTREGYYSFTPQYASPEQVLGKAVSVASDVYSLGVLLYLLLTNEMPYTLKDLSTEELIEVICKRSPKRPSAALNPVGPLDADLDSVVLKALRKEPAERYATVESLAADLQAWLAHRPVSARQGSVRYRLGKFFRRNMVLVSGLAVIAVVAAIGLAGVAIERRHAKAERARGQQRSKQLQQMSQLILSEIDDAIVRLPGSTTVEHQLLTEVLKNLDQLAVDAKDDPQMQLQMVTAYTRLANVQGNPYYQSIGDSHAAMTSLDKALGYANALHAADSNDPGVLHAYAKEQQSRSEVLYAMSQEEKSEAALQSALAAYRRQLTKIKPTVNDLAEVRLAYNAMGDQRNRRGADDPADPNSSAAWYRQMSQITEQARALDTQPERHLKWLAFDHMKIGASTVILAPPLTVREERFALAALDALPDAARLSKGQQQTRVWVNRELAAALFLSGNFKDSIEGYEEERRVQGSLALADPKNTVAKFWLAEAQSLEAGVYVAMLNPALHGDRSQDGQNRQHAIALFRGGLPSFDQLSKLAPDNFLWMSNDAYDQVLLGMLEQGSPQAETGLRQAAEGIAKLRKAASLRETPLLTLDFAVQASLHTVPGPLADSAWTLDAATRLNDRTQRSRPLYLQFVAQAANDAGKFQEGEAAATEGLRLLKPAPDTPLVVQRLLTAELHRSQEKRVGAAH